MKTLNYTLLPNIDNSKSVKIKPWYKGYNGFKNKFLVNNNHKVMDPKKWVFIKNGLDD